MCFQFLYIKDKFHQISERIKLWNPSTTIRVKNIFETQLNNAFLDKVQCHAEYLGFEAVCSAGFAASSSQPYSLSLKNRLSVSCLSVILTVMVGLEADNFVNKICKINYFFKFSFKNI